MENTQGDRDTGPESLVNFWVSLGQSGVPGGPYLGGFWNMQIRF